MKALKYISLALCAATLAGGATSCQDSYDEPSLDVPVATLVPNTTIADFKAAFGDEMAVLTPLKDADAGTHYILHGRVISSDASGNIYKSLVIQDETAAIALSINQSSMYIDYRLGQDIVIDATGMWIGMYNNYVQFGMLGEYYGAPQITFMAYDTFKKHTEKNGLPNQNFKYVKYGSAQPADNPYCLTFSSISEIPASGAPYMNVMSQLVEISNVSFVDAGKEVDGKPITFAPYQDNADRYIKDANGQTLNVRCSGYSSFYNDPLPEGVGSVRGILSRYGDSWQLLLRDTEDLMFDDAGTKDKPYTIEQALAMNNNGRTAWVEGYIIGCLKPGISSVSSVSDITFVAADAEVDNNVVIAPTADCRNLDEMMIVNLPQGSQIREWGNLVDNPDVLGKKMLVKGTFNQWLGMHGITDVEPGFTAFEIEGQEIPDITTGGRGTEDDPYTVAYINLTDEAEISNVWVEGYIVGWVAGKNFNTGANFSAFSKGDYSGNNLILGASPSLIDTTDVAGAMKQAIPVTLADEWRTNYGLKANPGKLGKHVKVRGTISTAFGARGFSSVSAIVELD